jgi:hypothetical protein
MIQITSSCWAYSSRVVRDESRSGGINPKGLLFHMGGEIVKVYEPVSMLSCVTR